MQDRLAADRRLIWIVVGVSLGAACSHQQADRAAAVLHAGAVGCLQVERLELDGRTADVCIAIDQARSALAAVVSAQQAIGRVVASSSAAASSSSPPAP